MGATILSFHRPNKEGKDEGYIVRGDYNDDWCACVSLAFAIEIARSLTSNKACDYAIIEQLRPDNLDVIVFKIGNRSVYQDHLVLLKRWSGYVPIDADNCIDLLK